VNDDEIQSVLRRAQALVESAEIHADLKAVAFRAAVSLLTVPSTDVAGTEARNAQRPADEPQPSAARAGVSRISQRLQLSDDEIARVYAEESGQLQLLIAPSRLPTARRAAMRELALAFVIGRQAGGWDTTSTSLATIRLACEGYGSKFFDSNNFMNAINDLGDAMRKTGEGKDLRIILTPTGYDDGRQLLRRLGGSQST
jgi:hypothetical protein